MDFLKRLRSTGSIERTPGSGRCVGYHAIDEWRRRLSACVDPDFEHYFDCYSQNNNLRRQHCKFDNWRLLFLFSFAVNVNEQSL